MLGFTLARLSYLNISGNANSSYANGSAPGEWYWFRSDHYRIGITLHLGAILPAAFLMIWQFVPVIRHNFLLFHRIIGYVIVLLVLIGNVGALMICRRAFGGSLETQAWVGVTVIITTVSIALAYYNIKRLQIDQHRAWMLRAAFYFGTIITVRLIMIISAQVITAMHSYDTTMSCAEIAFISSWNMTRQTYPSCDSSNSTFDDLAVVPADFASGNVEQIAASLDMSFGMAAWLALFIHAVGVEIYLSLTPREGNRLRQVSYERQLEKGLAHPGSAGLTIDRWGDSDPWLSSEHAPAIQKDEAM